MGSNRRKTTTEDVCRDDLLYSRRHSSCNRRRYHHQLCFQLLVVVILNLFQLVVANPVFVNNPSLAHFQSGRNIRHLPCVVRKSGLSGVCMFAIDCIKSNGTHLGTCIDRFYFGSCCQITDDRVLLDQEINDNSIDQNTISHFQHESTTLPTSGFFQITTPTYSSTTAVNRLADEISTSIQNITTAIRDVNATIVPIYTKPSTSTGIPTTVDTTSSSSTTTTSSTTTSSSTTTLPETTSTTASSPLVTTTTTTVEITSTSLPVLTTESSKLEPAQTTTIPTRITTFQVVDNEITTLPPTTILHTTSTPEVPTTTQSTTEPSIIVPSKRPTKRPTTVKTTTHRTTKSPSTTKTPPTTSSVRPTTLFQTSPVIETTRKPSKTTTHRPHTSTRRTTAKRPTSTTKRPITTVTKKAKPSKRPSTNHSTTSTFSHRRNATKTTTTKRPTKITTTTVRTTTIPSTTPTHSTKAPRPSPKPTSHIVRVPPTTITDDFSNKESTLAITTTSETPTKRPTRKPKPTKTTTTTTTTSTTTEEPTITSTTPVPTTSTLNSTTTIEATNVTLTSISSTSTTSTTSTSTTTTTEYPTPLTTMPSTTTTPTPPITTTPALDSTTLKPGLVTWTNLDELQSNISSIVNGSEIEDWKPLPIPDWVPLPTINPDMSTSGALDSTSTPILLEEVNTKVPELSSTTSSSTEGFINVTTTEPLSLPIDSTTIGIQTPFPLSEFSTPPTFNFSTTDGFILLNSTHQLPPPFINGSSTSVNGSSSTPAPFPSFEGIDYKQICGKRMFPEPRIVGGSNAAFGRWPWQISLRQWRTSTYLHKCGAALLNENWAITAAHCVDNVPPSDLLLRLGEYDLAEEEEPYGYQERRVQIVASHPQFDPRTFEYDLALLRFYEPVAFQPNIIPVCVPENDEDFIGQTAYVTGWGRLYEDGPLPSVLQEVSVPVINNTICETMYRSAGYIEHIPHIFICAGWKKGGYDSCEGDSGGPMVLQRDDKRFLLGGVISWGIGCAEPNQPGVYTRISEFRDWINQILQF